MTDHQKFEQRFKIVANRVGGVAEVARAIGVHPNTLYRISQQGGYPGAEVIIKIARKYHVDLNWLLGIDEGESDGTVG